MKKPFNLMQNVTHILSASDPDDLRRRQNLSIIIFWLMVLLSIEIPIVFFNLSGFVQAENLIILGGSLFMFFSLIGIFFVNRYKSGGLSAYIFLAIITVVITFSDTPEELANGRSLFIFMIPITVASLVLGTRTPFIFAAIGSAIVSGLSLSVGQFPNTPAILSYFLVALLTWMSSNSLQVTLTQLRAINADLDKIVIERTNELSEALGREQIEAGRSQAILRSIADGVIVFNKQDVAILVNPALSQLTGTEHHLLNRILLDEFINSEKISPASQQIIRGMFQNPEQSQRSTGIEWGDKVLSASIAMVQDPKSNENLGSVAVFRDITHETQLERMKSNFLAIVSHELRTPLSAILGYADILKEKVYGDLNEQQISVTERIMVNVTRLLSMVGDLLDEAQIYAGKLSIKPQLVKSAILLENLHGSMDKITADKGLSFVSGLGPEMPRTILCDPQRIQQILINLVGNAAKFTEHGGIQVYIDRVDADHWKMEVKDSGIGIPHKELPYIFDTFRQANNLEFATRAHGGFGLGLSIVKQLVELMEGEINVQSESGIGSTFTVLLPLKASLS